MKKTSRFAYGFLLATLAGDVLAREQVSHPKIQLGQSFLFQQTVESPGQQPKTYLMRFDAWGKNNSGGTIFTITPGPKRTGEPGEVIQTIHAIDEGGCVVDVLGGLALRSSQECNRPLPSKSWEVTRETRSAEVCKLVTSRQGRIETPAGGFDTVTIECRARISADRTRATTYWYAPSIGVVVKTVRKFSDANGVETGSQTEVMAEFSNDAKVAPQHSN